MSKVCKVTGRSGTRAFAGVRAVALIAGLVALSADRVAADSCGASCRSAYNQCRISTKGSPACESQFTSCMQSCRK